MIIRKSKSIFYILKTFCLMILISCEEFEGPMGPAGTANMVVEITQMTSDNTEFVDDDSFGSGDGGTLFYIYETEYVTQAVLDSGSVKVEVSDDNGETWYSMPYILTEGDDSGVEWIYTNEYYYGEGYVVISWLCSFDRSRDEWMSIENLWANDYKITIIAP